MGSLNNITLYKNGLYQTDNVNFDNTITLYTDNITNEIKTFATVYTSSLPSGNYSNSYITEKKKGNIKFLLQITKLFNDDNKKTKETYLQAHYTNELKLKIRFSKMIFIKLLGELSYAQNYPYFGNNENITIDINNLGTLGIRNNSNSPVKITIKPR